MNPSALSQLRSQISALTVAERAELARELIVGLDGPSEHSARQAWRVEISQRVARVQNGRAKLQTRDKFRQIMIDRLSGQQ